MSRIARKPRRAHLRRPSHLSLRNSPTIRPDGVTPRYALANFSEATLAILVAVLQSP